MWISSNMHVWVKAAHVAAIVLFVSGLLLLCLVDRVVRQHPKRVNPQNRSLMLGARAWDRMVTMPALLAVWVLGITLATNLHAFSSGWLIGKLVLVMGLSGLHGMLSARLRRQLDDPRELLARTGNFAPAFIVLATTVIVLLVSLKPTLNVG